MSDLSSAAPVFERDHPFNALSEDAIACIACGIVRQLDGLSISQAKAALNAAGVLIGTTQRVSVATPEFIQAALGYGHVFGE